MKRRSMLSLGVKAAALPVFAALYGVRDVRAAESAMLSAADRLFVAKVSQGGMFEVLASKVAETKAVQADVSDVSVTEVHDHTLVGAKLKAIAESLQLPFPTQLNAAFQARLDKLEALTGKDFDVAYIREMDSIHATDVAAFAEEAKSGMNPALRSFAAQTVLIVRRHIGALHAVPLPTT